MQLSLVNFEVTGQTLSKFLQNVEGSLLLLMQPSMHSYKLSPIIQHQNHFLVQCLQGKVIIIIVITKVWLVYMHT